MSTGTDQGGFRRGTVRRILAWALLLLSLLPMAAAARPLRLGLLPTQTALAFLVADRNGCFQEAGVEVELLYFNSGQERDTAVLTGNIDAFHAGWANGVILWQGGAKIAGVALTAARPTEFVFALMVPPRSAAKSAGDLEGATVAISLNTVEYVADRLLQRAGVKNYRKLDVPQMPLRLQMLQAGQIQAGVFVEPFATLAEKMGARRLVDTSALPYGVQDVLFFRVDTLDRRPEEVRAFLRAFARAVAEVRNNPAGFNQLMVDRLQLPEALKVSYRIIPLERPVAPQSKGQLEDTLRWMRENGLLKAAVEAQDLIRPEFLEAALKE
ncbi:MAG: ABC transporter substrate-binding protein [Methanocella sp.]